MSDQPIERIETGTWARVQGAQPGQETFEEVFHFVPSNQVDLLENKISIDSPLVQVLSGAAAVDKAQLETKGGTVELMVLKSGRG
jgi:transcription elongation GreA/GreB family factor